MEKEFCLRRFINQAHSPLASFFHDFYWKNSIFIFLPLRNPSMLIFDITNTFAGWQNCVVQGGVCCCQIRVNSSDSAWLEQLSTQTNFWRPWGSPLQERGLANHCGNNVLPIHHFSVTHTFNIVKYVSYRINPIWICKNQHESFKSHLHVRMEWIPRGFVSNSCS